MFDLRVTDNLLKEELLENVSRVLEHGRLFLGPEVEEFEDQIAKQTGTRYALGVASGSSALFMALKASGDILKRYPCLRRYPSICGHW